MLVISYYIYYCYILGRILLSQEKYDEAEVVFSECIQHILPDILNSGSGPQILGSAAPLGPPVRVKYATYVYNMAYCICMYIYVFT